MKWTNVAEIAALLPSNVSGCNPEVSFGVVIMLCPSCVPHYFCCEDE